MGKRPETVFHVVWLWDADSPAGNRFFYDLKSTFEFVATLWEQASVTVEEHHPEKGARQVLRFADGGLVPSGPYVTHDKRWTQGYPADFVQELLAQWPRPIEPRWRK